MRLRAFLSVVMVGLASLVIGNEASSQVMPDMPPAPMLKVTSPTNGANVGVGMDVILKGNGAQAFGVLEGTLGATVNGKMVMLPINGKAKADGTFEINLGKLSAAGWGYSLKVKATGNTTSGMFNVK